MSIPHFINHWGWLWTLASGVFVAGMLWSGMMTTEKQSASNNDAIAVLQTDMSAVKQEVHDLHDYLIPK